MFFFFNVIMMTDVSKLSNNNHDSLTLPCPYRTLLSYCISGRSPMHITKDKRPRGKKEKIKVCVRRLPCAFKLGPRETQKVQACIYLE